MNQKKISHSVHVPSQWGRLNCQRIRIQTPDLDRTMPQGLAQVGNLRNFNFYGWTCNHLAIFWPREGAKHSLYLIFFRNPECPLPNISNLELKLSLKLLLIDFWELPARDLNFYSISYRAIFSAKSIPDASSESPKITASLPQANFVTKSASHHFIKI